MSWSTISWRSIIAGVVTTLAVSIIMALLGVALGFTVINPMSDSPLSGLGTAFGVWSILSVLVSLAAGGYVAGMFSGIRGAEHGFMTWATVLLVGTIFSGLAIGGAVKTVGSVAAGVGSGVATVATGVGQGVSSLAAGAINGIQENVDLDFNADEIRGDVVAVLRDTGVQTLQPEYLRQQMAGARSDLRNALTELRLDSDNYDGIMTAFLDKQKARLDNITQNVDRETAVTTLMNNRNMSRAEAEETVDNALSVYNTAVAKAQDALTEAGRQVDDAKAHLAILADRAKISANEMASTAAKSAVAAAVALLLGAVVCCFAGIFGSRHFPRDTILIEEQRDIEIPIVRTPSKPVDRPIESRS